MHLIYKHIWTVLRRVLSIFLFYFYLWLFQKNVLQNPRETLEKQIGRRKLICKQRKRSLYPHQDSTKEDSKLKDNTKALGGKKGLWALCCLKQLSMLCLLFRATSRFPLGLGLALRKKSCFAQQDAASNTLTDLQSYTCSTKSLTPYAVASAAPSSFW